MKLQFPFAYDVEVVVVQSSAKGSRPERFVEEGLVTALQVAAEKWNDRGETCTVTVWRYAAGEVEGQKVCTFHPDRR